MKYNVITMGSAVVDAFVDTDTHETHGKICYPAGEKIIIKEMKFNTGGGGTNTAATFSKMGLKTGFLGKIGEGHNAGIILRELKKTKVDFLGKQVNDRTGYSIILDSKEHNRTILTFKGVNNTLKFSEISKKVFNTDWLYFASMKGESSRSQERLAKLATKKGIKIAYNPSMYLIKQELKHVKKILSHTDVLILNEEEAYQLVGKKDCIKKLKKLTKGIVCVTQGKKGSLVYNGETLFKATTHKNIKCAERTGAGDAFAAGFVSGLIKTKDITKAIQVGSLNAESVIQKPGAKNGILSWSEILKKMKTNAVKVHKKIY